LSEKILYRPAKASDTSEIVKYLNIAAEGVYEQFFNEIYPGAKYTEVMTPIISDDSHHYNYTNVYLAEYDSNIIGSVMHYHTEYYFITEWMKQHYPPERLEYLKQWYEQEIPESLLIDSLAVDQNYRSQGIGKELIRLAKDTAKSEGLDKLSLFVFEENSLAQKFYEREGFKVLQRISLKSFDYLKPDCDFTGSRLMVLEI
jgi:GNAT superfamily N-acetyltransferase